MKHMVLSLSLVILAVLPLQAYDYILDMPTGLMGQPLTFPFTLEVGGDGSLSLRVAAIPRDNLMFGLSYSGRDILGTGTPKFDSLPAVQIKYRVAQFNLISVVVGFDSRKVDDTAMLGMYGAATGDLQDRIYLHAGYAKHMYWVGAEVGVTPDLYVAGEWLPKLQQLNTVIFWRPTTGIEVGFGIRMTEEGPADRLILLRVVM